MPFPLRCDDGTVVGLCALVLLGADEFCLLWVLLGSEIVGVRSCAPGPGPRCACWEGVEMSWWSSLERKSSRSMS